MRNQTLEKSRAMFLCACLFDAVGQTVTRLEYEAYESMALATLKAIASQARQLALSGAFSVPSLTANLSTSSSGSEPSTSMQLHAASAGSAPALLRIVIAHRLGVVPPTETSIVIAVSCGHRRESFAACEWILEAVKKRAEIWMREVYAAEGEAAGAQWKANFPS